MEIRYWGPVYELLVVNTGKRKFLVIGHEDNDQIAHLRHLVKNLHKGNTVTKTEVYEFEDLIETLEYQELREQLPVLEAIANFGQQ